MALFSSISYLEKCITAVISRLKILQPSSRPCELSLVSTLNQDRVTELVRAIAAGFELFVDV
jgi:hypothetical protein